MFTKLLAAFFCAAVLAHPASAQPLRSLKTRRRTMMSRSGGILSAIYKESIPQARRTPMAFIW